MDFRLQIRVPIRVCLYFIYNRVPICSFGGGDALIIKLDVPLGTMSILCKHEGGGGGLAHTYNP